MPDDDLDRTLKADRPHPALEHIIDPALKQWATDAEARNVDAVNRHRSQRAAALALGIHSTAVDVSIKRLRRRAAIQGYDPGHDQVHPVRSPFLVKGQSTYYDSEGKPTQTWVKTRLGDDAYQQVIREAIRTFLDDVQPQPVPAPPAAAEVDRDVIPWFNIGDGHLGMLAQEAEVGENFDLKIAERELCTAIAILIDEMAPHERIVLNDLGDMTHYENFTATTEASGHILDFDSRFPKMIRVYVRVMRFMVERMLTKCEHLDVIINQGNHSRTNDIWMAELLRACYGHTGRVNVLDNDSVFIGYRMGKTLVMTHHSDKCKPAELAKVLAADFAQDWGQTTSRYVYVGHIHHAMALKEMGDCIVESFNTLAAKDRWAHDGGYRARQSLTVVRLSRSYGEVGRRVLPIAQIRDAIHAAHTGSTKPYRPKPKVAFAV